jgi:hypothetical protein
VNTVSDTVLPHLNLDRSFIVVDHPLSNDSCPNLKLRTTVSAREEESWGFRKPLMDAESPHHYCKKHAFRISPAYPLCPSIYLKLQPEP